MRGKLVTTRISCLEDIDSTAWNALVASCPDATCFQTYEWISSWWKIFGRNKTLYLQAVLSDDLLVAVAPLFLDSGRLRFIGEDHCDYNIFIWHASEPSVVEWLLDSILENEEIDVIQLYEIPEQSVLAKTLLNRQDPRLKRLDSTPCPRLVNSKETVMRALNKKSIKRSRNRLARQGKVTIDHFSDYEDIKPYLSTFFRHHIERWSTTEYPSLFLESDNKAFYEELARSGFPVIFSILKVNDKHAAAHFGMLSTRYLLWYKPAFDPQLAAYSPGEILLSELIKYVSANGLAGLDFTRGDEAFKLRFCSEIRNNVNYRYYHSTPYMQNFLDFLKNIIKRALHVR